MKHDRSVRLVLCIVVLEVVALLWPLPAFAQLTGSSTIAGVVKDTSGAVLPGVTVEASSPALIEKVRTVVTDDSGQYKVIGLVSGRYTVAFTLPGFSTVKREGIELSANFTASVNADLKVGGVEETIIVSGQTPVVDVQTTSVRNLIPRAALDALPVGKTLEAFVALTPGMSVSGAAAGGAANVQDVGGSKGELYVQPVIHGGRGTDARTLLDGFETNNLEGGGAGRVFVPNPSSTQEISVELGSGGAESPSIGVQINFVPKEGANRYSGEFIGNFTNESLQGDFNLTDELITRGASSSRLGRIGTIYDANGSAGGPLAKDRLWFFGSHRSWGSSNTIIGGYYNKTPGTLFFTPDVTSLASFRQRITTGRVTWQASARNKLSFSYDNEYRCQCFTRGEPVTDAVVTLLSTPEATRNPVYRPRLSSVTWNFPATSRVLVSAAFQYADLNYSTLPQPGQPKNQISILELSNNFRYGAIQGDTGGASGYGQKRTVSFGSRVSLAYVTGSHAFKGGMQLRQGYKGPDNDDPEMSPVNYNFRNGQPDSMVLFAYPIALKENVRAALGLYAQDQWTIKRLTLNLGIRYDGLNAYVPDQHLPAGPLVPARDFAGLDCVPCWSNLSPRLSAAYDLFGTGKSALKLSVGRYVAAEMLNLANANNPVLTSVASVTRSWKDANGDFVPNCDLTNPGVSNECGPYSDTNFGKTRVTTRYDDDLLNKNRGYSWQTSASFQQQLVPGTALSVSYFHTSWNNFTVIDNVATTAADYSLYCVTLPVDPRLPGQGGNQLCGLYDVNPDHFGQVNSLVLTDHTLGKETEVFDGLDILLNSRLPHGSFIGGGVSFGGTTSNNCFANARPDLRVIPHPGLGIAPLANNPTEFCEVKQPFGQAQVKISGSYLLPWQLQASASLQNLPGVPILASYVATNAQVEPSLGRPLSGGATSVTIANIIAPYTQFEDRLNQVDVRLTRNFTVGRVRVQPQVDVYNLFNANTVLGSNTRYGASWLVPSAILDPRLLKFGVQVNF